MTQSFGLIAERLRAWGDVPFIVREAFGDSSPVFERSCERHLGAGIERCDSG